MLQIKNNMKKRKAVGVEFEESEFAKMQFNPFCEIVKTYPALKRHAEFKVDYSKLDASLENNKVHAYALLVYDKNSPLHLKFTDLEQRKTAAIELVFSKLDSNLAKSLKGLTLQNFKELVTKIFHIQHEIDFEHYMTLLESFTQMLAAIREPITLTDAARLKAYQIRGQLEEQSKVAKLRLAEARELVFKEDKEVEKVVVAEAQKKKPKGGYVENMIEELAGNK